MNYYCLLYLLLTRNILSTVLPKLLCRLFIKTKKVISFLHILMPLTSCMKGMLGKTQKLLENAKECSLQPVMYVLAKCIY